MRIRVWRGRECVSILCTVDSVGVGLGAAPRVVYRHVEYGGDVECVPFYAEKRGTNILIDYRVGGEPGPYFPFEKHVDGSVCRVDLKSVEIHWQVKVLTFAFNHVIKDWSTLLRRGERAGIEGTSLDDDVLVTISTAKPRRPDGGTRAMRRHLSNAVVRVDGYDMLTVTYGMFMDQASTADRVMPLKEFSERVDSWANELDPDRVEEDEAIDLKGVLEYTEKNIVADFSAFDQHPSPYDVQEAHYYSRNQDVAGIPFDAEKAKGFILVGKDAEEFAERASLFTFSLRELEGTGLPPRQAPVE